MTTLITKTAKTGQQIEVRLHEYLPGVHIAQLYLDGTYVSGEATPRPLQAPRGELTHWLGREGKAVGLTAPEAALISEAIQAANAAARERPEMRPRRLMDEREGLVGTVRALEADERAGWERVMEDESEDGSRAPRSMEAEIQAARAAVRAFDAAHPEAVAAAKTERAASVARHEAGN